MHMSTSDVRCIKAQRGTMPDYLKFNSSLSELDPHEAESQLHQQLQLLQSALARLHDADRVRAEIFDCVVSV